MELFHDYREQWLDAAIQSVRPRFRACGYPLPDNIKVSCGWPVGSRGAKKVLGQCFAPSASSKGNVEIFISPTLDKPGQVMGVLIHELVHAAVGNDAGHGKAFQKACAELGLTGKATEALPGPEMSGWLSAGIMPELGQILCRHVERERLELHRFLTGIEGFTHHRIDLLDLCIGHGETAA